MAARGQNKLLEPGKRAPEFRLERLSGGHTNLTEILTGGPALLAFDRRDSPYYRAMANYNPPKLDCDTIAIVCEEAAKTYRFAPTVWSRLARAVRYNTVPGNHSTCITTHVEALAQSMSTYLADA